MNFIDIKMHGTTVKNMPTFVISLCCLVQSLWNESSTSETAGSTTGTDILESYARCSAIFHTFH